MSATDKPDPARAARLFANLVIDGETERIEALSDEEYTAELERRGRDPSSEMSVEDLLERVNVLATQKERAPERPPTPARTSGAHQVKPNSTTADARPVPRSTSPAAMKGRFTSIGGPWWPLSNSRATVMSPARSGSSRCPMPGGAMQESVRSS